MARSPTLRALPPRKKPADKRAVVVTPASALASTLTRSTSMDESPRGRILRAAAHLFLTQGYAQTTVRDLAASVGILSGSIFHHFDSKEEILEAVMTEVSVRSTERMQQAAKGASSPLGCVRALLLCELENIHGDSGEAMTLLVTEWRSLGAQARTRVLVVREAYEEVWLRALRAARTELTPLDAFILRRLISGMTSITATWYRPRGPMSLETLADHILRLVVRKAPARG
jgi:AcrR family transcriptional regulator